MKEQDPYEYTRKCMGKGAFVFMTYLGLLRKISCQQFSFQGGSLSSVLLSV